MKIQKTIALLAGFAFTVLQATAQNSPSLLRTPDYNKPKRFADLPAKQLLRVRDLESLLQLTVGANVAVPVSKQLMLLGTVVSVSNPADNRVKSVVVRSNNRPGTTFTFTRITESDGRFSYTGRMMGRETGDALEISKDGSDYVLQKRNLHELITE